jgi:hypothetical protein
MREGAGPLIGPEAGCQDGGPRLRIDLSSAGHSPSLPWAGGKPPFIYKAGFHIS